MDANDVCDRMMTFDRLKNKPPLFIGDRFYSLFPSFDVPGKVDVVESMVTGVCYDTLYEDEADKLDGNFGWIIYHTNVLTEPGDGCMQESEYYSEIFNTDTMTYLKRNEAERAVSLLEDAYLRKIIPTADEIGKSASGVSSFYAEMLEMEAEIEKRRNE